MDDLDALTASTAVAKRPQHIATSSSPNLRRPYVMNHRYVLGQAREVMAKAEAATASILNSEAISSGQQPSTKPKSNSMANRELPALPNTESRSMENLDALEASGLHGRYKNETILLLLNVTDLELTSIDDFPGQRCISVKYVQPPKLSWRPPTTCITRKSILLTKCHGRSRPVFQELIIIPYLQVNEPQRLCYLVIF